MEKIIRSFVPPPRQNDIPIVHKVGELYKIIYAIGLKMPKRDRFGIHLKIENLCLEILEMTIVAALETRQNKASFLNTARIKIEVMKHLIRNMHELQIIENKKYFLIENELIEISKMINGWVRFLKQ